MSLQKNITSTRNTVTDLNKANLRAISLAAMLGGWLLLIVYIISYIVSRDARFTNMIAPGIACGVVLTMAWLIQRRGYYKASAWVIIISNFATGFFFAFTVQGLGLALGVLQIIIVSMIAWQTLPRRNAILAVILSLFAGVLISLTDANFAQGDRLTGGFFLASLLVIIGGIVAFILAINGLRQVEFSSIGSQLRASFLIVALLPVFIITIFQTATLVNVLDAQARNHLQENAVHFASKVDSQIFAITNYIEEDAGNSIIINALRSPSGNTALIFRLAARYPEILSYGLVGKDGFLIIDHHGNTGGNEGENSYFKNAANIRITYISDVVLDEDTRRGVFFVSKPVVDENGSLLGVIRVKISAGLFQKIAEETARQSGEGITMAILDEANILLAHSANPELLSKTLSTPSRNSLNALQQSGRLPLAGEISANLDDLDRSLGSANEKTIFTSSVIPTEPGRDYITYALLSYKPWKILVAQHTAVFLAPAINQLTSIILITLALLVVVYIGANLTTSLLVTPVNHLASAAQELGKGKLDTPITLARKDELGALASVLDNTRQQIYDLLQTLEQRVEERTLELTRANEKNERRARQLETIAQVSRAVTSLRDLNQLLPEITRQISDSFGYYHAGIFLLDENREYAVLRAANSQGGQAMLARGHRLKVGRQGIVGNVTNTGRYRIALDVGNDAIFFNNPDLPETHSEIALPLLIGDNIIGALDAQSTEPNAFSEDDIKALSLLSDQISVAIENARLFDETKQALAQIREIYTESSESGWQSLVNETNAYGYRYAKGSVEPLRKKTERAGALGGETLEIPIMLRGEKLGGLKIRRTGRQAAWNETETRMYQAIAERMSFALENARLFSDARRRANLERVAAEAATKISASTRFETILRAAAEEISRLMDGSEVLVQIQPGAIENLENK